MFVESVQSPNMVQDVAVDKGWWSRGESRNRGAKQYSRCKSLDVVVEVAGKRRMSGRLSVARIQVQLSLEYIGSCKKSKVTVKSFELCSEYPIM